MVISRLERGRVFTQQSQNSDQTSERHQTQGEVTISTASRRKVYGSPMSEKDAVCKKKENVKSRHHICCAKHC